MPDSIVIEIADSKDAEAILTLQRLAFRSEAEFYQDLTIVPMVETLEELRAEFGRLVFLKARFENSKRIIGSVRASQEGDTCAIGRLIVHPDFQGQGIAGKLMRGIEAQFPRARRFELFTGSKSMRNQAIYRHLGYVPVKEQDYTDRIRMLLMEKRVNLISFNP